MRRTVRADNGRVPAKPSHPPSDNSGFSAAGRHRRPKTDAALLVAFLIGLTLVVVFGRLASDDDILVYEFTGDPGRAAELDRAVRFDFGFIAGFTLALGSAALFLRSRAFSGPMRTTMTVLLGMLGVAALSDVGEDVALLHHSGAWSAPFATLKFVMIVPVVLIVVGALLGHAGRAFFSWRFRRRSTAHTTDGAHVLAGSRDDESPEQYRWRRAYWVPTVADPMTTDTTAICLSGGGIRAGSVALGALQALSGSIDAKADSASRNVVAETDYIVSVSGGGFLAGAFLQAAHSPPKSSIWPTGMSETWEPPTPPTFPTNHCPSTGRSNAVRSNTTGSGDTPATSPTRRASCRWHWPSSRRTCCCRWPSSSPGRRAGRAARRAVRPTADLGGGTRLCLVDDDVEHTTVAHRHRCGSGVGGAVAGRRESGRSGVDQALGDGSQHRTDPRRAGRRGRCGSGRGGDVRDPLGHARRVVGGGPGSAAGVAAPVSSVLLLNYLAVLAAILWRNRGSLAGIVGACAASPRPRNRRFRRVRCSCSSCW